jgi:2-haloacid dehalogenase
MSKNILFLDLDDTILDFRRSEDFALRKTLTELNIAPTDEMVSLYSRINDACWKKLERGEMTREQVLTGRFALFFEEIGVAGDPEDTWDRYRENIASTGFLLDGAIDLLEELRQTYDLYAASNGTATIQDRRIANAGIAPYFKEIFISQRVGYNKPDKRFFDLCFEKIPNFDKSRAVMVGDSLTSDIKGGKNAGLTTVWYNAHNKRADGDIVPDYEVTSLDMLPLVLEMIFIKPE